jgi:hypothetical protein
MRKGIIGTITLLLVAMSVSAKISQTNNTDSVHEGSCGGQHVPGDTLTCYVTFDGATDFAMVQLTFSPLKTRGSQFILQENRRLDPRTYEVSGTIPAQCLPGTYKLLAVNASLGWNKGHRLYQEGFNVSIDILEKVVPVEELPPSAKGTSREGQAVDRVFKQVPLEDQPLIPSGSTDIAMQGEPAKPETNHFPDIESISLCGGTHAPGDRMTCDVRFSGEVELSALAFSFDMNAQERAKSYYTRAKDQQGLGMDFVLQEFSKIDSRTYRVAGLVNPCASGQYSLEWVTAFEACGTNKYCRTRAYRSDDIKTPVTFLLRNADQKMFPEILSIGSAPIAPTH